MTVADKARAKRLEEWEIKQLIKTIHRRFRDGPDAPPVPAMKPNGISHRAMQNAMKRGRNNDARS